MMTREDPAMPQGLLDGAPLLKLETSIVWVVERVNSSIDPPRPPTKNA